MRSKSFTIAIALLAAGGCVRESSVDCDGAVIVAVRDKNYDNAAEVGDAVVNEQLPMLSYITGLVTQNHPRGTNLYTPFTEGLTPVELTHRLPPERPAGGVNELTVVGDAPESAMLYGEAKSSRVFTLHPGAAPGDDLRLGGDAVKFPRADDHTVWLLRTKGKLIVDVEGAPDNIAGVGLTVGGLYATVAEELSGIVATRAVDPDAERFLYGGTVDVSGKYLVDWGEATLHLPLAPSVGATSPLTIAFTDASGRTIHTLGTNITIARNHITRIKARYEEQDARWTLTVNVDGTWTKIESMILS